jgi:hypothetical protein
MLTFPLSIRASAFSSSTSKHDTPSLLNAYISLAFFYSD